MSCPEVGYDRFGFLSVGYFSWKIDRTQRWPTQLSLSSLEIGITIPIISSVPRPIWNFRRVDWNKYAAELDAAVRFIPPTAWNYDRFNKLIISTAKKCIPRGYRKEYIPCLERRQRSTKRWVPEKWRPRYCEETVKVVGQCQKRTLDRNGWKQGPDPLKRLVLN